MLFGQFPRIVTWGLQINVKLQSIFTLKFLFTFRLPYHKPYPEKCSLSWVFCMESDRSERLQQNSDKTAAFSSHFPHTISGKVLTFQHMVDGKWSCVTPQKVFLGARRIKEKNTVFETSKHGKHYFKKKLIIEELYYSRLFRKFCHCPRTILGKWISSKSQPNSKKFHGVKLGAWWKKSLMKNPTSKISCYSCLKKIQFNFLKKFPQ